MERIGSLLHGHPQPLVWRRTGGNAIAVSDMLHALLRPGFADAGAIAQPVRIETIDGSGQTKASLRINSVTSSELMWL
jgi:hypothetical protein